MVTGSKVQAASEAAPEPVSSSVGGRGEGGGGGGGGGDRDRGDRVR